VRLKRNTWLQRSIRSAAAGPDAFIVAGAAYLIAGVLAANDPYIISLNPVIGVGPASVMVFIFGLAAFRLGVVTSGQAARLGRVPLLAGFPLGIAAAHYGAGLDIIPAAALTIFTVIAAHALLFAKLNHEHLFAAGFSVYWLGMAASGMPFFDATRHSDLFSIVGPLYIAGFLFMLFAAAKLFPKRRYLWAVLILSAFASTFRIYAGIAFIAWMVLEAGRKGKGWPGRKGVAAAAVCVALFATAFAAVGYMSMAGSYGSWSPDPLRTLEYRLAFTLSVFDDVTSISFPFGHSFGRSLTMEATEYNCRIMYGCTGRITSTAFGEAMLDFGLPGVFLAAWWAGAVLGRVRRKDAVVHAMLLASLICAVDVGINIFLVLEFIYLGWMRVELE